MHLLRSSGQKHHVGPVGRSDRNICTEFDDGLQDITSLFRFCSCHQEGLTFVVAQFLVFFLRKLRKRKLLVTKCSEFVVQQMSIQKIEVVVFAVGMLFTMQNIEYSAGRIESWHRHGQTRNWFVDICSTTRKRSHHFSVPREPGGVEVSPLRQRASKQCKYNINNINITYIYHNYCRYQLCYSCLRIVLVSMPKDIQFSLRGGPYSGFCTDKHWWWYDGVWCVVWWLC